MEAEGANCCAAAVTASGEAKTPINPYGRASLIATSSSRRFRAFRPSIGLFLTLFFLILRFVPIVFSGGLAAR